MKSPSGGLSEVITLREQLASKETEIQSARAQIVHLTGEIESSAKRHKAETDALTSDLIKAREYIEILLGENRSLRARMADAAGRVQKIQLDASGVRQRLNEEANKREAVEAHNRYLEERVRALEIPSPSASGVRGSGLLSKFCGVSCAPATSSRRLSGVRTPVSASRHPNKSSTPATPREDPYRELMTLLASPPSTPTQQKTN
jgi:DNA repair exonuclease SbcCD ATPase subunit